MRRFTAMVLISAPLMAALAACSSGGDTPAASPATPAPAVSAPAPDATSSIGTPAEPPAEPPTPATAATSASSSGSGSGGSGGTPRCHTGDLRVTIATGAGGGAAGSVYQALQFRNVSGHACTLTGYPGVSFVAGSQGTQVNTGFTRGPGGRRPTVRLLSGKSGYATIRIPQWADYSADACRPVSVRGFRIYPPDETASIFVSRPQKACSVKGQGVGSVAPITLTTS